jgi:ATP-dependent Clp protease ATP-binding subunit ClpB
MLFADLDRLRSLDHRLREAIRGQDDVISAVVERVMIGESGLATPGRPKASFLFIGPTGVGKTELARVLAQNLRGDKELLRLDMSEFAAEDAIKNFIGDQTGSLGRLGELLLEHSDGILLVDEIEKAHRHVIDVFLQILDAGRVTCGTGRTFDLSGFYLIFTSNLGALDILRAKHLNFTQIEKHVLAQVASAFRPEFLGRIDSKLVFRKLAYEVQVEIARIHLERERQFLARSGHTIAFGEDVLTFLLQAGFDKYLGARPLSKVMEKHIRFPLADYLVTNAEDTLSGTLRVHPAKHALVFDSKF